MAKFQASESREFPTLALTLNAGDIVDLPDGTDVAYLVSVEQTAKSVKDAPLEAPKDIVSEEIQADSKADTTTVTK